MSDSLVARQHYPSTDILSDHIAVVKILITASKLYNLSHTHLHNNPNINDTLVTLHFYVDILMQRYNITPPPPSRHNEYNQHFAVINLLKPIDIAALILQKAIRLHSIYHETHIIHDDTTADIKGYLGLLQTTGVPDRTSARAEDKRIVAESC
jgi:hypothetical protein